MPQLSVSPYVLSLAQQLSSNVLKRVSSFATADLDIRVMAGADALWVLIERAGAGGLAMRAAHAPGGITSVDCKTARSGEQLRCVVDTAIGAQAVVVSADARQLPAIRISTSIRPVAPLLIPFLPRDLYPLGDDGTPLDAKGQVEASQRGLNTGLCYFHVNQPPFGTVLYFQNLTALNDYFRATKTTPDGAVGGVWPELGYLAPTPPQSGTPPVDPLPAGTETMVSDAIIVLHRSPDVDEQDSALRFLQMLGTAYRQLDLPPCDYRDWVTRAGRTLHDLETSPAATIRHYGFRYVHPYTASEYPDIMVQMSVIAALRDFGRWTGEAVPLAHELARGLGKFYDRKLKTMRRYLPNVGKDKDADAVDSWYLYHPMLNLGRLALDGDRQSHRLFVKSLDFAMKVARHFRYVWPIQFKVTDFAVITEARNDDGLGQTDLGGLYAYVMLQAFELTDEARYLDEARAAIDAAKGMRFELNYQANLTAWGAAVCMRLWRITNERYYLGQSYVYLASFFHNTEIWESEIENAAHYRNFLGATCLHDAPYMALYECFDSFTAFERYMKDSGPDLEPAARMLISEYCKYALDRAWFYYPDALPRDVLATDVRNGYIDRTLSFPLEDLYADGQPAGQVGQEIYGAGAAFVFASKSFHKIDDAPFMIFCDHFLLASERTADRSLTFRLGGGETCVAGLSFVRLPRQKLPDVEVTVPGGRQPHPAHSSTDRIDYVVPANGQIVVHW